MIAQNAATAGVPPRLMRSTLKAATLIAVDEAAATGVISAIVAALTEGVLKTMLMTKLKIVTAVGLMIAAIVVGAWGVGSSAATATPPEAKQADQPTPSLTKEGKSATQADTAVSELLTERFEEIQKLIKPQPGESRWMEIPWQTSLWEARQKAAEEGKPIFVWFGSGGSPACHT